MEKITGSYSAHPEYYDHIDSFSLLPDNRFGYTLGGGQQIHVNVRGHYHIEEIDDSHFKLKLYDIWSYDEDEDEFIHPLTLEREAIVEIKDGLYVFEMPYHSGKRTFSRCLYFKDNPFKHLPAMDEIEEKPTDWEKLYEDYYYKG